MVYRMSLLYVALLQSVVGTYNELKINYVPNSLHRLSESLQKVGNGFDINVYNTEPHYSV